MSPLRLQLPVVLVVLAAAACGEKPSGTEAPPTPGRTAAADPDAAKLLEEGYAFKRDGRNGAALERFEQACVLLERALGPRDHLFASCLDDKAMIMIRMGRYDQARAIYLEGRRILEKDPDPLLQRGVASRLGLLDRLEALGIRCAEPAEPPADATLPYFPDVAEMQEALGRLGAKVRDCDEGRPRLVTVRVTVTGDGRALLAETQGRDAGSPVARCVEERLLEAVGEAPLPRFRACFRPFTYPFTVGDPLDR